MSDPVPLTIKEAHDWLRDHGFKWSFRQVQRKAFERTLPFQQEVGGRKLFIYDSELRTALKMPEPSHG